MKSGKFGGFILVVILICALLKQCGYGGGNTAESQGAPGKTGTRSDLVSSSTRAAEPASPASPVAPAPHRQTPDLVSITQTVEPPARSLTGLESTSSKFLISKSLAMDLRGVEDLLLSVDYQIGKTQEGLRTCEKVQKSSFLLTNPLAKAEGEQARSDALTKKRELSRLEGKREGLIAIIQSNDLQFWQEYCRRNQAPQ